MTPRLKTLELHGYKTFASRVSLDFPGNVTAVVGPNGSGKSNIADSIRWVLGEQSFSLLRGRKTEDMIFAGSELRPRAGMASASIVFNNEDGWLPIDFSEVSITRRAYRDGNNEYLLNGQRVRLKEISELLAQSGLAERTYTIIGQGLVDAALALKPEERRKFFEEAAGIGLYRGRRDEAIGRLDATRRNLDRVQDIISELQPRLASLEKQARRAMEYQHVKADLQVLLRDWYGYYWHLTQKDLKHAREVVRGQEAQLDQARQRLDEVEEVLNQQRTRLTDLRTQLNIWHSRSSELHRQREKISRDLAVMDERQRALQNQQQNLQSDLARLEEEKRAAEQRLADLTAEKERLQGELTDAQQQVEQARKVLDERQNLRARQDQALRETRRLLVSSETRLVELRAHQNELNNRSESLQRNQQNLMRGLANEATAVQAAEQKLEQSVGERKEVEAEARLLDEEMETGRERLVELETARRKLQEERVKLDAERSRLKAQIQVLEQAEKSFSGLNQGARFVLEEARQGRLKGRYRALNSMLDVPAELEQAVAAVLGDSLDAVLLEAETDLDQPLGLLSKSQKGRAVLLPLANARPVKPLTASQDADCLGVASDLVRAPAEFQTLVNVLLGQVLVVRNRAAARRLAGEIPANARVVTLDGEVFWGSGVVVAGQDGRSGVIGRPRQLRELQGSLEEVDQRWQRVTDDLQKLDADFNAARGKEQEREKRQRAVAQRLTLANQVFQKFSLELEQARQKQEWQRSQLKNMEGQIARTEEEGRNLAGEVQKAEARIKELNEKVRDQQRELNSTPVEEFQAQVVHWNTAAAVAGRAVQEAVRRLEEHRQVTAANTNQQTAMRQRLEAAESGLQQLEAERNAQREVETGLNDQIDNLQKLIDPAERDLELIEKEYTRLQTNQTAAQQTVTVAERHTTQAQLELTRIKESLDSLRRRIEEDFGLVALEYTPEVAGPTPLPFEGMVEQLPVIVEIPAELEENISRQRAQLRRMGAVNPDAQSEYQSVKERYDFMIEQVDDLKQADADLRQVITELDDLMRREFRKTFDAVAAEFKVLFTRLFGGGSARLILTDDENPTETGIDIETRLPGRREQGLSLLSGGERSLTAVALVFSLLKVSPTPFCVLDEVDAMLDEANVGRFRDLLMELSDRTQFIVITHNRNTVQAADVIYGITMGRDSASQMISLRLDEISDDMVK